MKKIIGWIGGEEITVYNVLLGSDFEPNWDSQLKWAILLTLAGYKEKNEIKINDQEFYDKKGLDDFGGFILNDTRAAPIHFSLDTTFNDNKAENATGQEDSFDSLLSFSGGIDSTAGLLRELDLGKTVIPMWIGFGQKNESDELGVINKISSKLGIDVKKVRINFKDYVDNGWSRWKLGIIPARNYLFSSFAANFINDKNNNKVARILICAHKEEITPINTDKSERFFYTSTDIFSNFYKRNIRVETPFKNYTKPEIVSFWHRNWEKKYNLKPQDTVSCYTGDNCGECKACINRAIAFTCAGVNLENFRENPFADKSEMIKNAYLGRFESLENERKLDFLYSLQKNYSISPDYVKKFVDENFSQYKTSIEDRILSISKVELL